MKQILHQKFKLGELTCFEQQKLHDSIRRVIFENGLDYILITTPTDLEVLEDTQAVIRIDAMEYTLQELLDVIEKAAHYDSLCK